MIDTQSDECAKCAGAMVFTHSRSCPVEARLSRARDSLDRWLTKYPEPLDPESDRD